MWVALNDPPHLPPLVIDWDALVQLDGDQSISKIVPGLAEVLDQFQAGSAAAQQQKAKGLQPPE